MADWLSEESIEERILAEHEQIARARASQGQSQTDPSRLVGLALSSGGLRSAVFCLGVLQGLAAAGLLRGIDYLSCVGGGGYIGGRLAAMIARDGFERANHDLAKGPILLPNAPSMRFLLNSAIGLLAPLLLLLVGTILLVWELLTVIVPLYWSSPSGRLLLLFQFTAPGASLMVLGAALFGLKKLFPTGRSISRFVGKRYLKGDVPLAQLASDRPYPLFGAVMSERKPIALSPIDRYSTAQAMTASGPPPDPTASDGGWLGGLTQLLARGGHFGWAREAMPNRQSIRAAIPPGGLPAWAIAIHSPSLPRSRPKAKGKIRTLPSTNPLWLAELPLAGPIGSIPIAFFGWREDRKIGYCGPCSSSSISPGFPDKSRDWTGSNISSVKVTSTDEETSFGVAEPRRSCCYHVEPEEMQLI